MLTTGDIQDHDFIPDPDCPAGPPVQSSVDGETIEVVEAGHRCPRRQPLPSSFDEGLGEARERFPRRGRAARDHTSLAGVNAFEDDLTDPKPDDAPRLGEEPVFPEGLDAFDLQVGPEAAANVRNGEIGKPALWRWFNNLTTSW